MTREQFENDDRFATIGSTEIACHGGICKAAAWMLDPENSTAFCAVLDTDDMQVATIDDDGHVVWEPLADFEA